MLKKVIEKAQTILSIITNHVYEQYMRLRLKNKDFTILCSNCIGGIISHRLRLPLRSPTVNLWMHQRDFLKFIQKLEHYIAEELVFVDTEHDYPVGRLDDIFIYFNHSKTDSDARCDWNRRKQRINYDNIYGTEV